MNRAVLVALFAVAVAIVAFSGAACAQLTPFGFMMPNIYHDSSSTAFTRDFINAETWQNAAVSFNPWDVCGGFGGFPNIAQCSGSTYTEEHTTYAHSQETTVISYPYFGFGGCGPWY